MILMVFDLGNEKTAVIPANNFLMISDRAEGKGSIIMLNLDDIENIIKIESTLPAKEALARVYRAAE